MNQERALGIANAALMIVITLVLAPGAWPASKYKTLHKFTNGKDGGHPYAGLTFDEAGSLYGTTSTGGAFGYGTVFKLTPNAIPKMKVLHNFRDVNDGRNPEAGVIFDQAGNLYGATYFGGTSEMGLIFKLTPNANGSWTESVLHSFAGEDGSQPSADLIFDRAGNLYGTTVFGGAYKCGVVFKLTPNNDGKWTESVLYNFKGGNDGRFPQASLIFDGTGNLYSTTVFGGAFDEGTVFRLTPDGDGSGTETVIHDFTGGEDGSQPYAGLIFDATGNLCGTALYGGAHPYGVVFELVPNGDGNWTEKVLHNFTGFSGGDGANPNAGLIFDPAGSLYGTTDLGARYGYGVVFKLIPGESGKWTERVLHVFANQPGAVPFAGLILDGAGNLYGTTYGDGTETKGTVFEVMP